jgi:hypothetical protein
MLLEFSTNPLHVGGHKSLRRIQDQARGKHTDAGTVKIHLLSLITSGTSPISLYFLRMDQLGGFSDLTLFPEHASTRSGHTSVGRDVAESVWAEDLVNRLEMPPLHEDYVGAMRREGTILEYEICGG